MQRKQKDQPDPESVLEHGALSLREPLLEPELTAQTRQALLAAQASGRDKPSRPTAAGSLNGRRKRRVVPGRGSVLDRLRSTAALLIPQTNRIIIDDFQFTYFYNYFK